MIEILFFFLLANNCFGIIPVSSSITVLILLFIALRGFSKPSKYKWPFIVILIGLILNIGSSMYYRNQTPWDTIRAMPSYFGLLFYFFLKYKHYSLPVMERTLLILIYTLDILFISQYYLYEIFRINFMNLDEWMLEEAQGSTRLRIMSSGLYIVGMFYGLVNWYRLRKNKYLILFVLGFFIMLLTGYRQFLISLPIVGIYMLWKLKRKSIYINFFTILLIGIVAYGIFQIPAVQEKMQGMEERFSDNQDFNNKEYIRIVQYDYFENKFFKSPVERVLGAGIPLTTSKYGKKFEQIRSRGLQYVDWSFLGVSWMLGTITVVGMIWLAIKVVLLKTDVRYTYFALYFLFLLISVTNFEFFRNGNFLVHSIIIYMAELASKTNRTILIKKRD